LAKGGDSAPSHIGTVKIKKGTYVAYEETREEDEEEERSRMAIVVVVVVVVVVETQGIE
jgi:hypothetical protein